jgi:hypothetical protein
LAAYLSPFVSLPWWVFKTKQKVGLAVSGILMRKMADDEEEDPVVSEV